MDRFFKVIYDDKNLLIVTDKKGQVWYNCQDVARILGYAESYRLRAVLLHVPDKYKMKLSDIDMSDKNNLEYMRGYKSNSKFMNETGLFRLALQAETKKDPDDLTEKEKQVNKVVEDFLEWVSGELLPQLKKDGYYILDSKLKIQDLAMSTDLKTLEGYIRNATDLLESYDSHVQTLQAWFKGKVKKESINWETEPYFDHLTAVHKEIEFIIACMSSNLSCIVENNALKRKMANAVKEISYWRNVNYYATSSHSNLYIRSVIIYVDGEEIEGFKFGGCDDMKSRMDDYKTANMSTHLVCFFPLDDSYWRNNETVVRRILRPFELKYLNELYYKIPFERIEEIVKTVITFMEDPLGTNDYKVKVRYEEYNFEDQDLFTEPKAKNK